ncbi:MAG: IS91 family transposase, partial [Thermincolia bacterium]
MPTYYQQMEFEMELRGYSPSTKKHYLSHIRLLEGYFNKPLDQILPEEIKQYLHHRIKNGVSYSSIDISCNALKVMFNHVLKRNWSDDVIVRPEKKETPGSKQQDWVSAQLAKLLPVGYFHVVFTLPQELNAVVLQNQDLLYSILVKSAGDTIVELAKDAKFLGAQTGVTAVLHTWGQNLAFHPHVHCMVPGGGLSLDGRRFVPSRKKFFIPV